MIKINDTITLLNLDTNEYEYFKLVKYTEIYMPKHMAGPYEVSSTKPIPTSGGGSTVDGFTIISTKSELGKNLLNKKIGDIIQYQAHSEIIISFKIVSLGKFEQNNSELLNNHQIKKKGLNIYNNAFEKNLIPILYLEYWSDDFCFVPEEIVYDLNKNPILKGTTFKAGKIYQENKEYDANKYFLEYDNFEYLDNIKSQYEYKTFKKLIRV